MATPRPDENVSRMTRALTDDALAQRLIMAMNDRRAFPKADLDALLLESARRLRWGRKADLDAGAVVVTSGGRAV